VVVLGVFVVLLVIVVGLHMTGLWKAWPVQHQEIGRSRAAWTALPVKVRVFAAACLVVGLALGIFLVVSLHG
jgi:hypothetical protein